MKAQSMNPTEIVTTDRGVEAPLAREANPFLPELLNGFYHGAVGVIVMGLLLSSCASMSHSMDTAKIEATSSVSESVSESVPRVVQMEEVQVWNPIERSEYFTARNR